MEFTGLEFTRNLLNLSCEVRDSQDNMQMRYTYLSDGTKVSALDAAGNGLLYRGNFVYEKDGQNVIIESIAWDEGRIRRKVYRALHYDEPVDVVDTLAVIDTLPGIPWHPKEPFIPTLLAGEGHWVEADTTELVLGPAIDREPLHQDQWFVRDHLGNVRSVIDLTRSATMPADSVILEQNDYLPYGTKSSASSLSADSAFRYRYAGKEEQRFGTFDSQLLDFGARYYDPWSCQWTAVDPMAKKCYGISAYDYCKNTPVNRVDPDGMTDYFDPSGAMVYRDLINNGEIRVVSANQAKDILEGNLSKGNVDDLNNGISQKFYESSETFTGALRSSTISYDNALNIVNHYCECEVVCGDLKQPNENGKRGSFGYSNRGYIIADFDVIQTDGLITRTQNGITVSEEALYDNSNNIKSSVDDHERIHQNDPVQDNKREQRAYSYQVNAPGFKNTTSRFQSIMIERSKKYGN